MRLSVQLSARRRRAYFWLLLSTIASGATFPIIKWGLGDTTPFRFLFYRFTIGLFIAIPIIVYYHDIIRRKLVCVLQVCCVEILGTTFALSTLYLGLARTTSLEAGLISTVVPVFLTVGGILFLREHVTKKEWLGLSLAVSMSIVLTLIPSLMSGKGMSMGSLWGNTLVMVQNLITVAYFLLAKRVYHNLPKMLTTSMSVLVGFVSFFLLSFIEKGDNLHVLHISILSDLSHPSVWIIAAFAAIVTSYIGLTTYMKGQDLIEASEASVFNYLQPAVFIPLSILLVGERVYPIEVICFGVVLIGVWIAEWKPVPKLKKKRRQPAQLKLA